MFTSSWSGSIEEWGVRSLIGCSCDCAHHSESCDDQKKAPRPLPHPSPAPWSPRGTPSHDAVLAHLSIPTVVSA